MSGNQDFDFSKFFNPIHLFHKLNKFEFIKISIQTVYFPKYHATVKIIQCYYAIFL